MPFGGTGAPLAPMKAGDVVVAGHSVVVCSAVPTYDVVALNALHRPGSPLPCKNVKEAGKKRRDLWFTNPGPPRDRLIPLLSLRSAGMR